MINNLTLVSPFIIQAAVQPLTESVIIGPFESSTLWIDDCIALLTLGY